MKLLQTQDQQDLLQLFQEIKSDQQFNNLPLNVRADIEYWIIDMKPKRVRTKKKTVPVENSLDNPSVQ